MSCLSSSADSRFELKRVRRAVAEVDDPGAGSRCRPHKLLIAARAGVGLAVAVPNGEVSDVGRIDPNFDAPAVPANEPVIKYKPVASPYRDPSDSTCVLVHPAAGNEPAELERPRSRAPPSACTTSFPSSVDSCSELIRVR